MITKIIGRFTIVEDMCLGEMTPLTVYENGIPLFAMAGDAPPFEPASAVVWARAAQIVTAMLRSDNVG